MSWSLPSLMANLHRGIEQRLESARETLKHPGTKGDASETIWLDLLSTYLPKRYSVGKGFVCDSKNNFSEQIDVIVYDRQYTPLIFAIEGGQYVVPAESVYAVFEAKQTISSSLIEYAQKKIATVRGLHRTSMPIPHAGGQYEPRKPRHILGGILSLESEWSPPLGETLAGHLSKQPEQGKLDMGCIATHGLFLCGDNAPDIVPGATAATAFLFELTTQLQKTATVPMLDVSAYLAWLGK